MTLTHPFPSIPETRLDKEVRTLHKAGHDVFVLCPNKGGEPGEELVDGTTILRINKPTAFAHRVSTIWCLRILAIDLFWKGVL